MRRRAIISAFFVAWVVGVTAYVLYHYSASTLRGPVTRLEQPGGANLEIVQAPAAQDGDQLSTPPPPQRVPNEPVAPYRPEPPRTLVGITSDELGQVERYLPGGAQIATYPVGENHKRAALISTDLDRNGSAETIVVHTEGSATTKEPTPPLSLSILSRAGDELKVSSSTPLLGGVLFNIDAGDTTSPLVLRDVTADGHKEIIVASGGGASLGGQLQVFTTNVNSLQKVAQIGGHFFSIGTSGRGESAIIRAQWKDEAMEIYEWNGTRLQSVVKNVLGQR